MFKKTTKLINHLKILKLLNLALQDGVSVRWMR